MIVKLSNPGGVIRYIEADQVFQQPLIGGCIDLEVVRHGDGNHAPQRFVIAPDGTEGPVWERAYIMERGKTVDIVRAWPEPK